jgi:hypothetical protein
VFGITHHTAASVLCLTLAPAAALAQLTDEDCLMCHEDATLEREDGTPVGVDTEGLAASIHGEAGLGCVDCHADLADNEEIPHAEDLAQAACGDCHDDAVANYARGVHGQARAADQANRFAATCGDCHGTHDIRPSADPDSRTYHLNIAATCTVCHGDAETIEKGGIQGGDVPARFADSIHGRALSSAGLLVAPTCVTCHGSHDVHAGEIPESRVARGNIPATCGSCHAGVETQYATSVHGRAVSGGNDAAAVCTDCHSAHQIERPRVAGWRLDVIGECGTCHEESVRTYRDTFHGKVTSLGFTRVATCADCHGAHDILPSGEPGSHTGTEGLVARCQACHPGASANFALYDPHADPSDPERSAVLHYTARFMHLLLAGVFSFFGLHTALWLPRSWRERQKQRRQARE